MKFGVISDTHLKGPDHLLEAVTEKYFADVDLILHAGDLTSMDLLRAFKGKEVIAVAGNADSWEVKRQCPLKRVIKVNDFKIGLIHGWGPPLGLKRRLASLFEGIDCIVYGHSHWAVNHNWRGVLYFNPGSFSRGIFSFWRRSIGLLSIEEDITGKIIQLQGPEMISL